MRRILLVTILLIVPLFVAGCGLKPKARPQASPSGRPVTTKSAEPVTGLGKSSTATVNTANYLGVDPASLDASLKANRTLAETKVKAWQSDAVLYHFSAKLPADLTIGQATEVYTYGSAADAYNWWTLNISGKTNKSVRALIPKEDYLGTTLQPIPLKFWQSNYIEALQLAEAGGGADFRSSHPDTQVVISLAVGEPKNYLWWTVEYQSATSEPYKILINPSTKEIIDPNSGTAQ